LTRKGLRGEGVGECAWDAELAVACIARFSSLIISLARFEVKIFSDDLSIVVQSSRSKQPNRQGEIRCRKARQVAKLQLSVKRTQILYCASQVQKKSKLNLCRGPLLVFIYAGMPGLPSSLVELVVGEASWQAGPLLICHAILLEPQGAQLV